MNGRRSIVGLCMLCALLVSAFAAQSASAITGTTAFTCLEGKGELRGAHCLTTGTANPVFGHEKITQDATTELTGTNAKTENNTTEASTGRLKVTIAGVPLELGATGVDGSGWMKNQVAGTGEHYATGEGSITFTGVQVTKPEGRGCKVYTHKEDGSGSPGEEGEVGVVHTRPLKATTLAQGDFLKFEPADGPEKSFANFWVTCEPGKQIPAIEGTWECKGSAKGVPDGATTVFKHEEVTTQNTLKCKGTKSGIDGKLTLEARAVGSTEYHPLAATTITT